MKKFNRIRVLGLFVLFISGCQGGRLSGPLEEGVSEAHLTQRVQSVLFKGLASEDALMRCHALESLAETGGLEIPGKIRKYLYDPVPAVRFAAAVAAGDVRDNSARPLLLRMLQDENISVKLAAGYGLEKLGDKRFEAWFDGALAGSDARLCGQACFLISKLGNEGVRQNSRVKLWKVLRKKGQTVQVRLQAAEALARLGEEKILKQLLVYASSGYADDRLIAISGLEYLGGADVYAMLTVLADDPQIEVQLAAIRALGKLADEKDLEFARRSMFYRDEQGDAETAERVRGLAALALGRIGKNSDSNYLYRAMADRSEYIRLIAAKATLDYLTRKDR
jgi:HEAT repeat protein